MYTFHFRGSMGEAKKYPFSLNLDSNNKFRLPLSRPVHPLNSHFYSKRMVFPKSGIITNFMFMWKEVNYNGKKIELKFSNLEFLKENCYPVFLFSKLWPRWAKSPADFAFSMYFFVIFFFLSKQHIPDSFLSNAFQSIFTFYNVLNSFF